MKTFRIAAFLAFISVSAIGIAQREVSGAASSTIDEILKSHSAAGDFNGTALVARERRILYQSAFGFANLEWNIPNDLTTKFEIGSMTKQFTAVLILQFVNEGKINLDGHVTDYLPYYRQDTGSRVPVSELPSHTSGIPDFISVPGFLERTASRTSYSVRDCSEKYCSGDLRFAPGSQFEYSNSSYFLLGAILEQVSSEAYERLLKERIFGPLGGTPCALCACRRAWLLSRLERERSQRPSGNGSHGHARAG